MRKLERLPTRDCKAGYVPKLKVPQRTKKVQKMKYRTKRGSKNVI